MVRTLMTTFALLGLFSAAAGHAEPLYWQASKGNKQLLLLGSVHMGQPEMYPLPEPVGRFLATSDALILEADLTQAPSAQIAGEAETAASVLNASQQQKLHAISQELNLPAQLLLDLPAWQAAVSLQATYLSGLGYQPAYGVDSYLAQQATQQNIPLKALESVDFQLQLFTADKQTGRDLLIDAVDNWSRTKKQGQCLLKNWHAGDAEILLAMAEESELSSEMAERFIYRRNRDWADKLDSAEFLSAKGRYMVVVGALHLVGERSLIELLAARGYKVKQLSHPEPVDCT